MEGRKRRIRVSRRRVYAFGELFVDCQARCCQEFVREVGLVGEVRAKTEYCTEGEGIGRCRFVYCGWGLFEFF